MQHRDGRFNGPSGLSVYYQYWMPELPPRAVLLVVHGAGEHSSRYQALAEFFCAHGFMVAALDHIGHGRSDGDYGHVERFSDYLETLAIFRRQVEQDAPGLPVILLGHSMGGLISAAYVLDHGDEFRACALSGPAIMTELTPGPVQVWIIKLLSALLPKAGVMQLDAGGVSRDPSVVSAYVSDPLVNHGKMSARFVSELFATMLRVQAEVGRIALPLLVMHGEADAMTAPAGAKFLVENASSTEKTLKLYPGLYHEIFNEPEREQVLADLLAWCEARLA
ncbi:alpha/beta hydrolase [Mangrovimicrobium sediminis]|uniref:Monoacylglycerol lipase n=1 Tax=Mangrovimicrobium sediminis TaxID=2562682 RepID=A0A4Z0LZG5_9GAMM|nr:alpha/beta hydrolase [Haliea sp. SAOS-164]TGD72792.1 alpha/beta hydrolase [Haliea sp. SAOS-164]